MSARQQAPMTTIKIVMERDHESFASDVREAFLQELASLLGLARHDIREVIDGPGCVVIQLKVPAHEAARLLDLWTEAHGATNESPEVAAVRAWRDKHGVTGVDQTVLVSIHLGQSKGRIPQAVALIHGWRGDAQSFGIMNAIITQELGAKCTPYEYPTAAIRESPSVITIARNLDSWIRRNADAEQIGIVAHSYGGHVVRQMISNQGWSRNPIDKRVKQITFVASPMTGSFVSTLVDRIPAARKAIVNSQVAELSENSPTLVQLNSTWDSWTETHVPASCAVRCIYVQGDDVVGAASAAWADREAVAVFGKSHGGVVDIKCREDEVMQIILSFLRDAGFQHVIRPNVSR